MRNIVAKIVFALFGVNIYALYERDPDPNVHSNNLHTPIGAPLLTSIDDSGDHNADP